MAVKEHVAELRTRVDDALKTDFQRKDGYLERWLRACDMNVDKAEGMLRTSLKWREANKVDGLLGAQPNPKFSKDLPFAVKGVDKDGRPIVEVNVGSWDWRVGTIKKEGKLEEFLMYICSQLERMEAAILIESGNGKRSVNQVTLVVNFKDYIYQQLQDIRSERYVPTLVPIFRDNYPEILNRVVCINAPAYVNVLLDLFKPEIAEKSLAKIATCGYKREEWEELLKDLVAKEKLDAILEQ